MLPASDNAKPTCASWLYNFDFLPSADKTIPGIPTVDNVNRGIQQRQILIIR